jgi:hypothetical protein
MTSAPDPASGTESPTIPKFHTSRAASTEAPLDRDSETAGSTSRPPLRAGDAQDRMVAPALAVPPRPNELDQHPVAGPTEVLRNLRIARLAFCKQIHGFGEIEPLRSGPLRPGHEILLYVELVNFTSKKEADGYSTSLTTNLVIETSTGGALPIAFSDLIDRSASRRNDFFCHYRFAIPQSLPDGRHRLRINITDLHSMQTTEDSLDFVTGESGLDK